MRKLHYCILLLLGLFFIQPDASATHVVGGELTYEFVDQNGPASAPFRYRIKLSVYVDRNPPSNFPSGVEPIGRIGVYNPVNNQLIQTLTLNSVPQNVDPPLPVGCNIPGIDSVSVTLNVYQGILNLPVSFTGFNLLWQRCCRNNGVLNFINSASQGNSFFAFIPPSIYRNTSPQFTDLAIPAICTGDTTTFINNAVDPDGDQLIYSFVTPFNDINGSVFPPSTFTPPPPNVTINTAGGYSIANPFGPGGFASINASTGLSTYRAPLQGLYVVALEILEFRNVDGVDILMGRTRRELQLISKACPFNPPPVLTDNGGATSVVINVQEGQPVNFTVNANDNSTDSIIITPSSNLLTGGLGYNGPLATMPVTTGIGSASSTFNWIPGCGFSGSYTVNVSIQDKGCPPKTSNRTYLINVEKFRAPARIDRNNKVINNKIDSLCISNLLQTYQVNPSTGTNLSWSVSKGTIVGGSSGNSVVVRWDSVGGTGSLKLVETSPQGCRDSVEMTARIFEFANAQLADTLVTICEGNSAQLTATGGSGFTWIPSTGLSNPNIANPIASPSISTLYRVFPLAVVPGCSTPDSIQVNVTQPLRAAGPDISICSGDTVTLGQSSVAGYSYLWTGPISISDSTIAQPSVILSSLVKDTSFFVLNTVDSLFGCIGTDTARILVNTIPQASITNLSGTNTICQRGTIVFAITPSGTLPLLVTLDSNGIGIPLTQTINQPISRSINFPDSGNFNFSVSRLESGDGCINTNPDTIIGIRVNPLPTGSLTRLDSGEICVGDSVTFRLDLTGTAPWSVTIDSAGSPITFNNIVSQVFDFTINFQNSGSTLFRLFSVTDANNCNSSPSLTASTVVVNPLPTALLSRIGTGDICSGDSIRFQLNLTGTAPWTVLLDSSGQIITLSGITSSVFQFARQMIPSGVATFFVTSVSDGKGCTNETNGTSVNANVNPLPTALLQKVAPVANFLCKNDVINFSLALTGTAPWTVQLDSAGTIITLSGINSSPFSFSRSMGNTGLVQFFVTSVSDANGCVNSSDQPIIEFVIKELPTAILSFDEPVNGYCIRDTATLTISLSGLAPWNVVLDSGGFNQTFTSNDSILVLKRPLGATGVFTYRLIQVSDSLCTVIIPGLNQDFTVNPLPTAFLERVGQTGNLCAGDTALFRVTLTGASPWTLLIDSMGTILTFSNINTPIFNFSRVMSNPGSFSFRVAGISDFNSCSNDSSGNILSVLVNPYPQALLQRQNPGELCAGDSADFRLVLTGTSPWTVNIDSAGFLRTITGINASPFDFSRVMSSAGTFNFRIANVVDQTGCLNDTIGSINTVVVNPLPTAILSRIGTGDLCSGDTLSLQIQLTGTAPRTVVLDSSGTLITFSGISSSTFIINKPMLPDGTFAFFVTSVDDGKGCINPQDGLPVSFVVNPLPTATFSKLSPIENVICSGDMVTFNVALTGASPWRVIVDSAGITTLDQSGIAASPFTFARVMQNTGNISYSLNTVTDNNGCTILPGSNVSFEVKPLPTAILSFDAPPIGVCLNDTVNFTIDLTGISPWSVTLDSSGVTRVISSPTNRIEFSRAQLVAGVFPFRIVQVNDSLCTNLSPDTIKSFRVNDLPNVDAGPNDSICSGLTTTVGTSAEFGWSYSWTPSGFLNDTTLATPIALGFNATGLPISQTLKVKATIDSTGCVNFDSMELVINPNPIADAGPDRAFCSGDTVLLGGPGLSGFSYVWSSPVSATQNTLAQPFYSQTVPNGNLPTVQQAVVLITNDITGCIDRDTTRIQINPLPDFSLGPDLTVCSGVPAVFNQSVLGPYSFLWLDSTGVDSTASISTSVTLNNFSLSFQLFDYVVRAENLLSGCENFDTVQILVLPEPRVNAGPDQVFCSGDSVIIGSPSFLGHTYTWNPGLTSVPGMTDRNASQTSLTLSTLLLSDTLTFVIRSSFNGCENFDTVNVIVHPRPADPIITGGLSICPGATNIQYNVPFVSGNTYFWGVLGGTIASGQGNDTLTVNWGGNNNNAQVTVVATNIFGCTSDTISRSILINPILLTQTPQGLDSLCFANANSVVYSITNTNGSAYNWQISNGVFLSPNGTNSITVAWNSPGTGSIWLTETAIFDTLCFGSSDTLLVEVLPEPSNVNSIVGNMDPCEFSSGTGYSTNGLTGSGFTWAITGGSIVTGQGTDSIRIDWSGAGPATISYQEVSFFGCIGDPIDTTLTIQPTPQPSLSGIDTILCAQQLDSLPYLVSGFVGSTFDWFVENGTILSGQGSDSVLISWSSSTPQSLNASETSAFGCLGSSDTLVLYFDRSGAEIRYVSRDINLEQQVEIGYGLIESINFISSPELLRRRRTESITGPWFTVNTLNPTTDLILDVASPDSGIYEYQIRTFNLCGIVSTSEIHNTIKVAVSKIESEERSIVDWNPYVNWINPPLGSYELWRKLDDETEYTFYELLGAGDIQFTAQNADDGFRHCYKIRAVQSDPGDLISWSDGGCITFDHELTFGNVITVNGDGKNDTWIIDNANLYEDIQVRVMNRWGKTVYSSNSYKNDWSAQGLESGTYFYSVRFRGTEKAGFIQVLKD